MVDGISSRKPVEIYIIYSTDSFIEALIWLWWYARHLLMRMMCLRLGMFRCLAVPHKSVFFAKPVPVLERPSDKVGVTDVASKGKTFL